MDMKSAEDPICGVDRTSRSSLIDIDPNGRDAVAVNGHALDYEPVDIFHVNHGSIRCSDPSNCGDLEAVVASGSGTGGSANRKPGETLDYPCFGQLDMAAVRKDYR
jgi:hypothetical protein